MSRLENPSPVPSPVEAAPAPDMVVGWPALPALSRACLDPSRTLRFTTVYYGVLFTGQVEPGHDRTRLCLSGDLGSLPYSVEAAGNRRALCAILEAAAEADPVAFTLAPDQHILLEGALERAAAGGSAMDRGRDQPAVVGRHALSRPVG